MQESRLNRAVFVSHNDVGRVQGPGVLHLRGGIEAAGALVVGLLDQHRDREGGTLDLEVAVLVTVRLSGCVFTRVQYGWGWMGESRVIALQHSFGGMYKKRICNIILYYCTWLLVWQEVQTLDICIGKHMNSRAIWE